MASEPEGVEDLYGLDPEEFTAARDRLVKQLKADGDKDAGASVRALRKPAISAWALNQVARRHPDTIAALLDAGAALRHAQEQALAGGSGPELRAAAKSEQQSVAAVAGLAGDVLRDAGRALTPAVTERMTGTLRAAAAGGEAADLLRRGRLTTDMSPAGFGLDGLLAASAGSATPSAPEARPTAADERRLALEQEAAEASQRAEAAADAAEAADQRATEAERVAAEARRVANEAARQAALARDEARAAETRLRRAR